MPRPTSPAGVAIASALGENAARSRLHTLVLCSNRLGDAATCAFGTALLAQGAIFANNAALGSSGEAGVGVVRLRLSGNAGIGDPGAKGLALGVSAAGPWLRYVDLTHTGIGASGYDALATAAAAWERRHGRGGGGGGGSDAADAEPLAALTMHLPAGQQA